MDTRLLGGRRMVIAINVATLVNMMNRARGVPSATRTEHAGVTN
jgi:hypothetical protein